MKATIKKLTCFFLVMAMLSVLFAGCGEEPAFTPTDVTPQSVVSKTENTSSVLSSVPSEKEETEIPEEEVVSQPENSLVSTPIPPKEENITPPVGDEPVEDIKPQKPAPVTLQFCSVYQDTVTNKIWKRQFTKMEEQGLRTTAGTLYVKNVEEYIAEQVLAGKTSADVYEVDLVTGRNLARKKVLANLLQSSAFQPSLYQNGGTQALTINGKTYGVSLDSHANVVMMLYNKELIQKYGNNANVASLLENNQWNFETFRALAKQCSVDLDGNGKNDIYGMTSNTAFIDGVVSANVGGYALMNQEKAEPSFTYQKGINALDFARTLYRNDRSWLYKANLETAINCFVNEEACMAVLWSNDLLEIAPTLPFDYGVAPMPVGYDQTEYIHVVYDTRVLVVPTTVSHRLEYIGQWFNGVAQIKEELLIEQSKNLSLDGAEMFQQILANTSGEYGEGAFTSNITSQVEMSVVSSVRSTVEKIMTAVQAAAEKELDDYYKPFYEE